MSVGLQNERNEKIDAIRGVAILLVLFHHFNIAYRLNDTWLSRTFGWEAVHAVARNGNYGVTMFFVVSGYLITSNTISRWAELGAINARAFYGLRIARIVPCLLLLIAVVNVLAICGIGMFQNHAESGTPVSFWLVNAAALTFWMNVLINWHGWVNYPLSVLWSLSVEEVFYVTFPILCIALRRESRLLAFWLAIIVTAPLYRLAHQSEEAGFLYAYLASFDGIAIGCCTAVLARRIPMRWLMGTVVQVVAVASMGYLYVYRPIGETNVLGVTMMALGTATLLVGAHHRGSGPAFGGRPPFAVLQWFGRLSYELYLFHLIVLGLMREVCPPKLAGGDEKLLLLAAFMVLSAALSAVIARYYAAPLNRIIRGRFPSIPAMSKVPARSTLADIK